MNKFKELIKGFSSIFDITGKTYEYSTGKFSSYSNRGTNYSDGFSRDREALAGDWQRVGNDLRKAMGVINNERK